MRYVLLLYSPDPIHSGHQTALFYFPPVHTIRFLSHSVLPTSIPSFVPSFIINFHVQIWFQSPSYVTFLQAGRSSAPFIVVLPHQRNGSTLYLLEYSICVFFIRVSPCVDSKHVVFSSLNAAQVLGFLARGWAIVTTHFDYEVDIQNFFWERKLSVVILLISQFVFNTERVLVYM